MPLAPTTHGLPHPRATTAAWLVMPPRDVRIPFALHMPPTSSALVSSRTKMHGLPSDESFSASLALKTMAPTAAPGDAGNPRVTTRVTYSSEFASSVNTGCRHCSSEREGTIVIACSRVTQPSAAISVAMRTAAAPVRFPTRHCSTKSVPDSIVNSTSIISEYEDSNAAHARLRSAEASGSVALN